MIRHVDECEINRTRRKDRAECGILKISVYNETNPSNQQSRVLIHHSHKYYRISKLIFFHCNPYFTHRTYSTIYQLKIERPTCAIAEGQCGSSRVSSSKPRVRARKRTRVCCVSENSVSARLEVAVRYFIRPQGERATGCCARYARTYPKRMPGMLLPNYYSMVHGSAVAAGALPRTPQNRPIDRPIDVKFRARGRALSIKAGERVNK